MPRYSNSGRDNFVRKQLSDFSMSPILPRVQPPAYKRGKYCGRAPRKQLVNLSLTPQRPSTQIETKQTKDQVEQEFVENMKRLNSKLAKFRKKIGDIEDDIFEAIQIRKKKLSFILSNIEKECDQKLSKKQNNRNINVEHGDDTDDEEEDECEEVTDSDDEHNDDQNEEYEDC